MGLNLVLFFNIYRFFSAVEFGHYLKGTIINIIHSILETMS